MSNFRRETYHPITGECEMAEWLDDYFGNHRYGVRFPNGDVFKADDHKWKFGTEHREPPVVIEKQEKKK